MVEALVWLVIGVVVGWVVPQPSWMSPVVDKVKGWFK